VSINQFIRGINKIVLYNRLILRTSMATEGRMADWTNSPSTGRVYRPRPTYTRGLPRQQCRQLLTSSVGPSWRA